MEHALTKYRKSLGLTLEAFGDEVGAAKGTVSRWENRKAIPRPEFMRKIADMSNNAVTANDWYSEAVQ